VRALCDWQPPAGVREIARRAQTDPGYVTRIVTFLEREDVVSRDNKGQVIAVNWKDLLRRWAQDYAVSRTNRAVAYLDPRGTEELETRLRKFKGKWALTGSAAVQKGASTATPRSISCYVESPEDAAANLGLRSVDRGANVILLEPFDSVIWERPRKVAGLTCVAISQCAVDLLTGTGREPSEAEALIDWMDKNQDVWRA
jgi:transcriptional regulator with AbiEi antitoxin domain of type IV toxin-antitoxin system